MGELGDLLRKAREDKGLSLSQVEEATRIRRAYLQALEEEAFDRLPAAVYVKGFLKNYSLFLGLDAQHTAELYLPLQAQTTPEPVPAMMDEPLGRARLELRSLRPIALVLVALALVATGWWAYARWGDQLSLKWPFSRPSPSPTAVPTPTATILLTLPTATYVPPSPTPTPLPTATPAPTATPTVIAALEMRIEVVGERAWVLVQADDQRVFAGILEPGSTNNWTARERILLRCGNAGAVMVTLNGQELGVLGTIGQVIEQEWTAPGVPTLTPAPTTAA